MKRLWVAACVATLAVLSLPALAQVAVHPTTLSAASGRYVFGQINGMARDQYMLDTQTGRLWQMTCVKTDESDSSRCRMLVLQAVPYDSDAGVSDIPPTPRGLLHMPRSRSDEAPGKK